MNEVFYFYFNHNLQFKYILFFFFNDTATTEIYTLSLHDALPICGLRPGGSEHLHDRRHSPMAQGGGVDRKSTRLNSSHSQISYAVFCLKKKKNRRQQVERRQLDDDLPADCLPTQPPQRRHEDLRL